jgi:hypothetical protein
MIMRKFITIFLALAMAVSIGTIGASALAEDYIWIYASTQHARIGDYVYYPVYYEAPMSYGSFVNFDSSTETNIIFPFDYDPEILKPVGVTPSELLYGMDFEGDIVEVVENFVWTTPDNFEMSWSYFNVGVNFKGYEGIENGAILFNVKLEVISEEFYDSYGRPKTIFNSGLYIIGNDINDWKSCNWEAKNKSGTVSDFSDLVEYNYRAYFEGFVLDGYEPFIPPVEPDITEVTYVQQEDTHKDFTVTANGRKTMIQFIEPDGGTRTYDRYHKNVKITSYNADGEVVNAMARDLAYEVWEIYSNMSVGNEIKVRGKENYKWDEVKYTFTIEPYNPIISMKLSLTSGKKGPVPATVVADDKTEKVMFKMPDNTTVTVASKAIDENGNKIFTGKAWMNKEGLNEIRILIYRNKVWRQVGTLEYTVE